MEETIRELPYNKEKFEKHIHGLIEANRRQLKSLNKALKHLNKGDVTYKAYVSGYWPEYDQSIEVCGDTYEGTVNEAVETHKKVNHRSDNSFQASIQTYAIAGKLSYKIADFDGAKFLEERKNGVDISRPSRE